MINLLPAEKQNDPRYKLDYSRPVHVYRNLHKKCYSVRQDGLVKGHFRQLAVENPRFVVNTAGRTQVRKTKTKNVHAVISGKLANFVGLQAISGDSVTYNPYIHETFVLSPSNHPITTAKRADLFFSTRGRSIVKVQRLRNY